MSDLEAAPPGLLAHHERNPWHNDDDPDEADISGLHWRQVGPGRIAMRLNRTISPPAQGPSAAATAIGTFATMLNSIMASAAAGPPPNRRSQEGQDGESQDRDRDHDHDHDHDHDGQEPERQGTPGVRTGSGTLPGGHRFTYSSHVRLIPRDTDRPANVYPPDDMNK